jgi:hypothetical protein
MPRRLWVRLVRRRSSFRWGFHAGSGSRSYSANRVWRCGTELAPHTLAQAGDCGSLAGSRADDRCSSKAGARCSRASALAQRSRAGARCTAIRCRPAKRVQGRSPARPRPASRGLMWVGVHRRRRVLGVGGRGLCSARSRPCSTRSARPVPPLRPMRASGRGARAFHGDRHARGA